MEISFVTTNTHKFAEAIHVLEPYPITLTHLNYEYEENHDADMRKIVTDAVVSLVHRFKKPIVIEDTGLFFNAYENFPGALPKFVFTSLGYKGIFKLLAGEDRSAFFVTLAGFGEPGKEPVLFEGTMLGTIATTVFDPTKDVMPYDRIFIPDGYAVTISQITLEEKNSFSQRGKAFRAFGEYIASRS